MQLSLTPEQEEACNWWAQLIGSEFAEKDLVRRNFESTLLAMFDKSHGINTLDDLDFTPIKEHLDEQRELKRVRPGAEKRRE